VAILPMAIIPAFAEIGVKISAANPLVGDYFV
jgi:hypothetical protein